MSDTMRPGIRSRDIEPISGPMFWPSRRACTSSG